MFSCCRFVKRIIPDCVKILKWEISDLNWRLNIIFIEATKNKREKNVRVFLLIILTVQKCSEKTFIYKTVTPAPNKLIFNFKRLQNHINLIKLWLSRAVVKQCS